MATYKQNAQDKIGTTDQITNILLNDIDNFGDTQMSLYRQDEAIIIKILLATYHLDSPDVTVGSYLKSVSKKKIPSIIAMTRAIHRSMTDNLPSYKQKRKLSLQQIQGVRPDRVKIASIVDKYIDHLDRTNLIVQYYIEFHNISKKTRLVDWLDIAAKPEVPSLGFVDIFIMKKEDEDRKSKGHL